MATRAQVAAARRNIKRAQAARHRSGGSRVSHKSTRSKRVDHR